MYVHLILQEVTPSQMNAEHWAAAAGTVTAMLAANAAACRSPEQVVQKTWDWLAEQPEDAAELAALLFEAAPKLGVPGAQRTPGKSMSRAASRAHALDMPDVTLKQRLGAAQPMPTGSGEVDWSQLTTVASSEMLKFEEQEETARAALAATAIRMGDRPSTPPPGTQDTAQLMASPRGELVEVNSGGHVLFCFFQAPPRRHPEERCLIVKFLGSRLLTQSEQFANELTRHLGICAPACRILRQKGSALAEQLQQCACALVMEYVPGPALFSVPEPFEPAALQRTAADVGRLLLLDMLLGNPDRFPCEALGWRGNPNNVLYCSHGRLQGRLVAIDACVQRRPPGAKVCAEDAACNQMAELVLNDLEEVRASLQASLRVKGLLEMMFEVLSNWIDAFIEDVEEVEEGEAGRTTPEGATTPRGSGGAGTSPASSGPLPNRRESECLLLQGE
eukprot:jgi/Astpho2/5709/Aster-02947